MSARPDFAPNPFPGLCPFEERDATVFFGRDTQVDNLLDQLGSSRFVAVIGTSASGKSSLVRAGLVSALHGGFMAGAGSRWRIATMRPGGDPIGNLARELNESGALGTEAADVTLRIGLARAVLERGELGLVEVIQQAGLRDDENVLVVVDQFEELFRFKQDRDMSAAFVKLLLAAAAHKGTAIYVLLTMRSDFLGDCSQFRDLPETINDGLFLVPRLTRDQLRESIKGPIGVAGAEISPILVNRLLNELGDSQDQLPVLQHALMRTWEIWKQHGDPAKVIDSTDFDEIGGLAQALSLHGDLIYKELPPSLQLVTEKIFKALTDRGSDNRGLRRPTRFADACATIGASPDEVREVVEAFSAPGCSFLMPPLGVPLEENTVLDISHESLMRNWKQLRTWVDEEAQSVQNYRRVAASAKLHSLGEAALWRDPDLAGAERWRDRQRPNCTWAERYAPGFEDTMRFLDESIRERERQLHEEKIAARRRQRITAVVVLALAILTVASTSAFLIAQRERSDSLITQSRFLARDAQNAADQGNANLGALLALEALPKQIAYPDRPFVAPAEYALEDAVANSMSLVVLSGHDDKALTSAAFSFDGKRIVTASRDGSTLVWDVASGTPILRLLGHSPVNFAAFSPDGKRIGTASDDNTARVWDAVSGGTIHVLRGHGDMVRSAAFSPDGKRIVTASSDKTARVWDAASGAPIHVLRHDDEVWSAAFSPHGERIVTASIDQTASVWDATTGKPIRVLRGHTGPLTSAAFSPDGTRIVTASYDQTARVWDATTGKQILKLIGNEGTVYSAAFSPDGTRIVTASYDKTVRIWDATSGAQIDVLRGHANWVNSAAFSPDGKRIVTASDDRTARVWRATNGALTLVFRGHRGTVYSAAFSPHGERIVTASLDKTARVWDATTGKLIRVLGGRGVLGGHTKTVSSAAFSPDGKRIVTASYDQTARVWNAITGKLIRVLRKHTGPVNYATFSHDGKQIITASDDNTARVWDASTGKPILRLVGHEDGVTYAAFSPDGKRIVTASDDSTARVLVAASGKLILKLIGHEGPIHSATFSPDGTRIVTASDDETAHVWDAATGKQILVLSGFGEEVWSAAFSSDGKRVVTGSADKTVRVWDAATGKQILVLHQDHEVYSAAFSPDGKQIVTASTDGTARMWSLPPRCQALIDLAHTFPVRLSEAERLQEFIQSPASPPLVRLNFGGDKCE
jgi:WD40 repeat protein